MLIFVVARFRLDRYEELRLHFEHSRDVTVVLDRREGERRTLYGAFSAVDLRCVERRHRLEPSMRKLCWSVIDTDELIS